MEEISQAEKVKRSQLAIAKSMQVSDGDLKVLESVQEWTVREWLYVCALDGIDLKEFLGALGKSKVTAEQIKKKRTEFLKKRLSGTETVTMQDLRNLKDEVKSACEESRKVRNAVTKMIKSNEAADIQSAAQEQIAEKEAIIADLKSKNSELEEKIRENKNKTEEPEQKKRWWSSIFFFKRAGETQKFVEKYLQDDRFSLEQIEFLLECIESGMRIRDIEKFAIPGVSVEVMRRLKNL